MALTMVHLWVADRWAQNRPEYLDCPEYYLGAISPDAITIRDGFDKSRKDYIHLNNWRKLHREPVMEYWRARPAPFDIGYGVHVLTDCQWVARYKARIPGILLPDGKMNTEIYYNDTFITDFALYHSLPRLQALLALLPLADVPDDHPLLTRREFDEWRKLICDSYRGECPRHDPITYIDVDYVKEFIDESIPLIDEVYDDTFPQGHGMEG